MFLRALEGAMHELPMVASFAASHGAPFFGDAVADFVSGVLAPSLLHQAGVGVRLRAPMIAPRLEGPSELMAGVPDLVRRRHAWLVESDAVRAVGIDPLDAEARDLSRAIRQSLERQLLPLAIA
jgi:hypothetical protein